MQKIMLHLVTVTVLLYATVAGAEMNYVTVGTGEVGGVYFRAGGAICMVVNHGKDSYGVKATVDATAGSVNNISAVLSGDLDFGIAQSDIQYKAYNGLDEWSAAGPRKELRSVFSLHPESITLIASGKSGITDVKGLSGGRIYLGSPGSGQLQNAMDVLEANGLRTERLNIVQGNLDVSELIHFLQDDKIDAFFYTVGHPNRSVAAAISGNIKANLVPISGNAADKMVGRNSYYAKTLIPRTFYPKAAGSLDVESIGVFATLVASSALDEETVYVLTKAVFDNFEQFKKLHPAFSVLTRQGMLQGLSAPVHPGALRYYRQADLVQYIDPRLIQ